DLILSTALGQSTLKGWRTTTDRPTEVASPQNFVTGEPHHCSLSLEGLLAGRLGLIVRPGRDDFGYYL
ncbi:MAG: hypothetical protein IKZ91_04560, partial [Bacteroidales bacterium]|nr:hypothetical protein [Bacteroidales bacterium]